MPVDSHKIGQYKIVNICVHCNAGSGESAGKCGDGTPASCRKPASMPCIYDFFTGFFDCIFASFNDVTAKVSPFMVPLTSTMT